MKLNNDQKIELIMGIEVRDSISINTVDNLLN